MEKTTLCYIEQDDKYLMLHRIKRKEDINKEKWIGVGGHFLDGETSEECLLREVKEETGLTLMSYLLRAKLYFNIDGASQVCYLYTADAFKGILTECDEGELKWFPKSEILNLPLWSGDPIFLKKIMSGSPYFEMVFNYENNKLISYEEKL